MAGHTQWQDILPLSYQDGLNSDVGRRVQQLMMKKMYDNPSTFQKQQLSPSRPVSAPYTLKSRRSSNAIARGAEYIEAYPQTKLDSNGKSNNSDRRKEGEGPSKIGAIKPQQRVCQTARSYNTAIPLGHAAAISQQQQQQQKNATMYSTSLLSDRPVARPASCSVRALHLDPSTARLAATLLSYGGYDTLAIKALAKAGALDKALQVLHDGGAGGGEGSSRDVSTKDIRETNPFGQSSRPPSGRDSNNSDMGRLTVREAMPGVVAVKVPIVGSACGLGGLLGDAMPERYKNSAGDAWDGEKWNRPSGAPPEPEHLQIARVSRWRDKRQKAVSLAVLQYAVQIGKTNRATQKRCQRHYKHTLLLRALRAFHLALGHRQECDRHIKLGSAGQARSLLQRAIRGWHMIHCVHHVRHSRIKLGLAGRTRSLLHRAIHGWQNTCLVQKHLRTVSGRAVIRRNKQTLVATWKALVLYTTLKLRRRVLLDRRRVLLENRSKVTVLHALQHAVKDSRRLARGLKRLAYMQRQRKLQHAWHVWMSSVQSSMKEALMNRVSELHNELMIAVGWSD